MKKNFFKKLSFVMALAMIASIIAPAAGAFAATDAHLNATKKYLHLAASTTYNVYDFNVAHKEKGWQYAWTSSNEDVATVDSVGFTTATGVGTAKISVAITDKNGEDVATLDATVVVRDNIETVKISNLPDKALAVGQEYDFNRSFVTVADSTTATSSITRWSVDSDKATISDSGLFKATQAGDYNVTAMSFQSKEKFEAWKVSKDTNLVLASDTQKVTVAAGIVETKQTTLTKFEVTFDSDMSKTDLSKDTAKVYQIINGKQVATGTEKIKSLTLDATGKVATVEMYTQFNEETEYNFVYGDLVGKFTSSDVDLADVASIEFADTTANIDGTATHLLDNVVGKDKNGVVIFTGDWDSAVTAVQNFNSCVSFAYDGTDLTKSYLDASGKQIYVYSKGFAAPVTATFTYYLYNETTKVYDTITLKDSAIVTGVETDSNLNAGSMQYAVATAQPAADSSAWTSAHTVAAGDTSNVIYTRYKNNNDAADAAYTVDATSTRFAYDSTNTDKLIINGQYMYPIAAGVVTVLVKDKSNDNKVVGTFDVTIMGARTFASATIDNAYVSVNNSTAFGADGTATAATITLKDSMGAASFATAANYSLQNGPQGATAPTLNFSIPASGDDYGKVFVKVDANAPATAGAYNFKITLTANGSNKDLFLTVLVVEGQTNTTVTSWRLELSQNSFDLKEVAAAKDITITVAGYNSNNVQVASLDGTQWYDISISKDGTALASGFTDTSFTLVSGASPAALTVLPTGTGTYVVTAKATGAAASNPTGKVAGAVIGTVTFALTDTTTKTAVVSNPVVASADVMTMVKNAFTFYLNGTAVSDANEANITGVTYFINAAQSTNTATVIASGASIYVTSVTYKVDNADGTDTVYTFSPNATIKAN